MLDSEKRATARDSNGCFVFLESQHYKSEPVIFDDPFDDGSNLA